MTNIMQDDIVVENKSAIKTKIQKPKKYAVIFHNDDFTPMDFVVHVLDKYFQKSIEDAKTIMLEVHHNGKAIVGLYTKEIADQKVFETMQAAETNNYPLVATFEEYDE